MPSATAPRSSKLPKALERSYSNPDPRKRRVVKRRGRAKGEFESDEEIEREVRTDSDTDDDNSSIDSDSESESSSSELHADPHSEIVTPSTTQSPPPAARSPAKDPSGSHAGLFADATNWAEMVAGEAENGAADLPVIDFADMDPGRIEPSAPPTHHSRKGHKTSKKTSARATSAPPPVAVVASPVADEDLEAEDPVASTSHISPRSAFPSRVRGQTARQMYQQRLETDPSFVPKVGEFWGHDDRLLDKEFRSLSGWWRGRWQSRGRGRGAFGMRGRGRGFYSGPPMSHQDDVQAPDEQAVEVPPVDRPWTHDGFEEMKRKDERRGALQEQQQRQLRQQVYPAPQRGFGFRGRGFVPARGRGAFTRGGGVSPSTSQRPLPPVSMGDRVWYAQKPDKMWTKQHDIFLYSDMATKPRPGVGQGVRVKLPGSKAPLIVRLPPKSALRSSENADEASATPADDKVIVVRIPSAPVKAKATDPPPEPELAQTNERVTTVEELSIEEVFTVRPNAVPNRRVDLSLPSTNSADSTSHGPPATTPTPPVDVAPTPVSEEVPHPIEQLTVLPAPDERSSPSVRIQETILRNPPPAEDASVPEAAAPSEESHPAPPALHPLQTSFSPVPPPTSPPYGSPYTFAPALPPGVAVNHQGMTYEYATGRPVYIQPTPPPMYTPRPMMHAHHPSLSVPFVPSHLRHHSAASPDFTHPHTPQTPPVSSFVDPATGVPIFSPARQSSRVEIRAPVDGADGKRSMRPAHQRSSLSTSVAFSPAAVEVPAFIPQQSASGEIAGMLDGASEFSPQHSQTPPVETTPAYAPYPHQYYYPDQYNYPQYMDMSQHVHYDMYSEHAHAPPPPHPIPHHQHHPSQPIVYY